MMPGAQAGLEFGRFAAGRPAGGRGTLPAGVTPTGLVSWFDPSDASSLTLSGGAVSRVADKWGTFDLTQPNAALRPSHRTDFSPNYLGFDTAGLYMLCPALAQVFDGANPFTIVYTWAPQNYDGNQFHFSALGASGGTGGGGFVGTMGNTYYFERTGDGASGGQFRSGTVGGLPGGRLTSFAYYDGAGGNMVNSVYDLGGTLTSGATAGVEAASENCWLGGDPRDGGTRYFLGVVGEIFVYDVALQGSDLTNVEAYLKAKWSSY